MLRRRPIKPARGRVIAVKWGLNPNSSSLGVDVTFLLLGAATLSIATPVVSALARWKFRKATPSVGVEAAPSETRKQEDATVDKD